MIAPPPIKNLGEIAATQFPLCRRPTSHCNHISLFWNKMNTDPQFTPVTLFKASNRNGEWSWEAGDRLSVFNATTRYHYPIRKVDLPCLRSNFGIWTLTNSGENSRRLKNFQSARKTRRSSKSSGPGKNHNCPITLWRWQNHGWKNLQDSWDQQSHFL